MEELEVDQLIEQFDLWFQGRKNEPLTRSERAIVKTFCWYMERELGASLRTPEKKETKDEEASR